jgi:hypothetical protein
VHGVVRWRLADLMQWLWEEEYQITISKQTLIPRPGESDSSQPQSF